VNAISPPWHTLSPAEALTRLHSSESGLTSREATRRLAETGPNRFERIRPTPAWRILARQFRGILVLLLGAALAVAVLSADFPDAIAIAVVLVLNAGLGFATELRARRAVEGLLSLEVTPALVWRDGQLERLEAEQLVPGDLVELEAGEAVPADVRLLTAVELATTEAALTGESLPVAKRADATVAREAPLPDRLTMAYKSSSVARGRARGIVVATGMATEVGRIGALTAALSQEATPLERRLEVLGRLVAWVALAMAGLTGLAAWFRGLPFHEVVRTAVALAVAAVPEGLPAIATITLALGVHRMARRHALVRRLPAVEALGSASVICTDKTGTLTRGEMTVTALWLDDRTLEVSGTGYCPEGGFLAGGRLVAPEGDPRLAAALRIGALANRAGLVERDGRWSARGDPTEAALLVAARKAGMDETTLRAEWPEVGELPFSSERMMMATFHATPDGVLACAKGAPDRILERSTRLLAAGRAVPLDRAARDRIHAANQRLAARGLRILALAEGLVPETGEADLSGLTLVALVGLTDPPAAGVGESLSRIHQAGIRVVMLTGDQPGTALAVARELGLTGPNGVARDGSGFELLPEAEQESLAATTAIWSRVGPAGKPALVAALQRRGEVVAMLGDGVNDAIALRKADIGVAMGGRGTDLAREAADLVLTDDRFPTVVSAVEEGRVILANITKAVNYLFSCNLAEILVVLGGSLAGHPTMLLPLQILWLNLLTDTAPALALSLEPADPEVMRQPPRSPRTRLLDPSVLRFTIGYGLLIAGATMGTFAAALLQGGSPAQAGTVAFLTLALAQVLHLGNARSAGAVLSAARATANRYALAAVVLTLTLQAVALAWKPLAHLLGLGPLAPLDWALVAAGGALPALLGQGTKLLRSGVRSLS
jgi:Ca2+-transporting ATPase